MKKETKEIIREICSHWICADEKDLERVANELDDKIDEMVKNKSQKSDSLPCVSESKSFDIHNCINEVCDAVHARFHLYGQTAKGDGSFRWRVKQAIDKMLYSR